MPKVLFVQEHREVEVEAGRTIKDIALELGIDPNRKYQRLVSCEGHGLFDGCKCWIKDRGAFTHEVKKGESVSIIAAQYDTSPYVLAELNGMGLHDLTIKPGQTLKVPACNGPTFAESMLHDLKGWQRLACQARLLRGEIEVWTLAQGDERLREPRPIAPRPPNPPKRTRFLESRFKNAAPEEGEEEEKPKKAAKPAAKAAAAKPAPAAKPAETPAAEAKPAEEKPAEPKPAEAPKQATEPTEAKAEAKSESAVEAKTDPSKEKKESKSEPPKVAPVESRPANLSPIVSPITAPVSSPGTTPVSTPVSGAPDAKPAAAEQTSDTTDAEKK